MSLLSRVVLARPRLFAGIAVGLLVYPVLPQDWTMRTRSLIAWDAGTFCFVALALLLFLGRKRVGMAEAAERQEEGEWTIFVLTVGVVVFSMIAVLDEFSGLKDATPEVRTLRITLVAATLLLSWLMTHVTFAFRYAHEYYEVGDDGRRFTRGLIFPSEPGHDSDPDYADFLYFAIVLGMTFQVSDVQITANKFRRMAMLHGLLSFLFNATIIALTVNLAAGLL